MTPAAWQGAPLYGIPVNAAHQEPLSSSAFLAIALVYGYGLWEKEVFRAARVSRIARLSEPFPGTLCIETHGHATTEQLLEAIHLAYLPWQATHHSIYP